VVVKCYTCGKSFIKEQHRINRTKYNNHFCSRECYNINPIITQEKTGREIKCDNCGDIIYKSGAMLKSSKSNTHFCSRKCSAQYKSKQIPKNTLCDNCGIKFRKSPSTISQTNFCCRECWKIFVKSNGVSFYRKFKKDICELCGFVPIDKCQLDVHHIDGVKNNNIESNLETLCSNCHRIVHFYGRK